MNKEDVIKNQNRITYNLWIEEREALRESQKAFEKKKVGLLGFVRSTLREAAHKRRRIKGVKECLRNQKVVR